MSSSRMGSRSSNMSSVRRRRRSTPLFFWSILFIISFVNRSGNGNGNNGKYSNTVCDAFWVPTSSSSSASSSGSASSFDDEDNTVDHVSVPTFNRNRNMINNNNNSKKGGYRTVLTAMMVGSRDRGGAAIKRLNYIDKLRSGGRRNSRRSRHTCAAANLGGRRSKKKNRENRITVTTTALSYSSSSDDDDEQSFLDGAEEGSIQSTLSTKTYIVHRWNTMFDRLVGYQKKYGDTNVPKKYNENDTIYPKLGNWVSKQRYEYSQVYQNTGGLEGQITPKRISRLESIGFVWELGRQDEWETKWMTQFQQLQQFQLKYNSTKVPILDAATEENSGQLNPLLSSSLGRWVKTQRIQRNKYLKMNQNNNDFVVLENSNDNEQQQQIQKQMKTQRNKVLTNDSTNNENNDVVSTNDDVENDEDVDNNNNKKNENKGRYSKMSVVFQQKIQHHITMLDAIDFEWSGQRTTPYDKWLGMYFKVLFCYSASASVSSPSMSCSTRLIKWSEQQRQLYHDKDTELLSEHKIALLNEIPNFEWNDITNIQYSSSSSTKSTKKTGDDDYYNDISGASWEDNYQELQEYYTIYNSTLISTSVNEKLGTWTQQQRDDQQSNVLEKSKITLLEQLDFEFDLNQTPKNIQTPNDISWYSMYDRLLSYRTYYETTVVPNQDGYDRPLANWVNNQRVKLGKYMLPLVVEEDENDENEDVDNNDGTVDDITTTNDSLDDITTTNDSSLSSSSESNFTVLVQRIADDLGCRPDDEFPSKGFIHKLSPRKLATRVQYLNDIAFVWDVQEVHWQEMYQQLCVATNNNNNEKYNDAASIYTELSVWMLEQRRLKKCNELSTKRIELLNDITFDWEPQTTNWLTMYDKLCVYANQWNDDAAENPNSSSRDRHNFDYAPNRSPTSRDPELGLWCHTQRRSYKRKTLSQERIDYLNTIDFVWEVM